MLGAISIFFLYKGILFYTDSIALVMALYLIAPFTIDATQIKNFMAMSIWIYLSKYLFNAVKQRSIRNWDFWIYIIGVLVVTTIHFSFIFTLVYVLAVFIDLNNNMVCD